MHQKDASEEETNAKTLTHGQLKERETFWQHKMET